MQHEIDEFSRHEVIHTAHLLNDAFDRWILQHRAVLSDPVLARAAETVGEALGDFYQTVGNRFSSHWKSRR